MHKSISNELDNVTLFVSNNVENTIENASVDLQMCGILPLFNEYLDYKMYGLNEESELIKKEVDFIFENLLEKRYAYLQMMFVDGNNKEIVSTRSPVYKNNNAIEQQQKIVFDEKRKYKSTSVMLSEVYENSIFQEKTIRLKYQISKNSYSDGYIILDVSLNKLFDSLNNLELLSGSGIYLLGVNQNRIFTSKSISNLNVLSEVVEDTYLKSKMASIAVVGWHVGLLTPKLSIYAISKEAKRNIFILAIIALLLIALLSLYLSKLLSMPAEKIITIIKNKMPKERLSNVSFASELKKSGYEFERIAQSLDEMLAYIDKNQEEMNKLARHASIGKTASQIAHDIRKPLTSMKAVLTMLPEIKDNPDLLNKFMADVDRNISQTNAMLSEILEFSSDSLELDKKQCDVQSLILAVLSDVFRGKEAVNISIEYDFEHNKYIHADINRMIRVFTNIVGNAVEAMQGKGRLFFKTYDVGENVEIHIGNSGSPIPEEIIPKLFDPFFTKNKKGGTGLGLSISQKLVELHGGQISVYSFPENDQQDEVTKFILTIPSCGGDIVANPDELIRHSNELKMFKEEKAVRIDYGESKNMSEFMKLLKQRNKESYLLIMDDEPLFRETVRSLIRSIPQIVDHIKVIEASSAEEALMLFKECAFDYVIADIDMGIGKMNGYEFAGTVLEKYPCTHVLIHSNKRKKELDKNIREIKSSRFMGFLPKPMKQSELLQFLALKTFETIQEKTQAAKLELKKRKRNVLIANDDTSLLLAFKILLKSQNVNVFTAASVERALDHINNDKIDIILSDINFGEGQKDGYSLLSKVRNMDPNVPFYLISGYSRSEEEPKAKKMGATGYLQQPVNPDELRKLVSDLN